MARKRVGDGWQRCDCVRLRVAAPSLTSRRFTSVICLAMVVGLDPEVSEPCNTRIRIWPPADATTPARMSRMSAAHRLVSYHRPNQNVATPTLMPMVRMKVCAHRLTTVNSVCLPMVQMPHHFCVGPSIFALIRMVFALDSTSIHIMSTSTRADTTIINNTGNNKPGERRHDATRRNVTQRDATRREWVSE